MSVLMLFLDGVGIGHPDRTVNPFFHARLPVLTELLAGHLPSLISQRVDGRRASLVPLDATLGVEGFPQSGTGQTALFTGLNASQMIGKHFGPYPYSSLRPVIEQSNIFRRLRERGKSVHFANAFPKRFFHHMKKHPTRLTVPTLSCTTTGMRLMGGDDIREEQGISADITGEGWHTLGNPEVVPISPTEAGRRLARLAQQHDFVLFEYWKTDHAGHAQDHDQARDALERLDGLLGGIIEEIDGAHTLLLITSDHGNIEDLSTKSHTRNPVPCILYGEEHEAASRFLSDQASLLGVVPLLMNRLDT